MSFKDISQVDDNFKSTFSKNGITLYDVNEPPFALFGLYREENERDFKRLPKRVAEATDNNSVRTLYTNTAGIRLRFKTDSKRIILKCKLPSVGGGTNMPLTGSSSFDMYADGRYTTVFRPGVSIDDLDDSTPDYVGGYTSGYTFAAGGVMRDILISFPLYNDVDEVYIGLDDTARLLPADEYTYKLPVYFYGSSITQGGCASHPGASYQAIISRRLDTDFCNLGFSGGCRAEEVLGEHFASLPMSIFVLDYDHNAPDIDYLRATHYTFYELLRKKRPELPIVMISAADQFLKGYKERREVIRDSYNRAVQNGDKNVYFIDGGEIYRDFGVDYCVVDTVHPNDLGFLCMANAIEPVIKAILDKQSK